MESTVLSRFITTILCVSLMGLPLGGGEFSMCFAGTTSFQHNVKHEGCHCASATCKGQSCCCSHHGNTGFSMCGCGNITPKILLTGIQPPTAGESLLRDPRIVEEIPEVWQVSPFKGGRFSYPDDYGGMGVLLKTCSLRS